MIINLDLNLQTFLPSKRLATYPLERDHLNPGNVIFQYFSGGHVSFQGGILKFRNLHQTSPRANKKKEPQTVGHLLSFLLFLASLWSRHILHQKNGCNVRVCTMSLLVCKHIVSPIVFSQKKRLLVQISNCSDKEKRWENLLWPTNSANSWRGSGGRMCT